MKGIAMGLGSQWLVWQRAEAEEEGGRTDFPTGGRPLILAGKGSLYSQ
jgi:hypothetical protein